MIIIDTNPYIQVDIVLYISQYATRQRPYSRLQSLTMCWIGKLPVNYNWRGYYILWPLGILVQFKGNFL